MSNLERDINSLLAELREMYSNANKNIEKYYVPNADPQIAEYWFNEGKATAYLYAMDLIKNIFEIKKGT